MSDKKILHVIVRDNSSDEESDLDIVCVGPNRNSQEENEIVDTGAVRGWIGLTKDEMQKLIDDAGSKAHHVYALVPR